MSSTYQDRIDGPDVIVHVRIAAEPATVWMFLSDAERFAAWIGAHGGGPSLEGTRVEAKVGGAIRVAYPGPGSVAGGRIVAMDPLKRIVFTWGYETGEHGLSEGSTQVEITLTPVDDGTLVQLRHTGLSSDAARQGHLGGWKHYLSMLARAAAEQQQSARPAEAWDEYFRAWGEPDETARRKLLDACCEPDVRLRTSFACTDGIEAMSQHIANALRHMPGMALQADGAAQVTHGYTRIGWKVLAPNGSAVMFGENVGALSLRGRFTVLVSFPAAARQPRDSAAGR